MEECKHEGAYHFHENAPPYCPKCGQYIEKFPPREMGTTEDCDPDESYCFNKLFIP